MPIPGAPHDDVLVPLLRSAASVLPGAMQWTDAHTHTGCNDPDGVTGTAEELLAGLDRAGHRRAIVFTTAEPDGYREPNDRVLAEAAASGGRLVAFCRVDPNEHDAVDEARRCLAAGARGIKLHPRSDGFSMPHPVVEQLVALAEEHRVPVLFHAGRGIPALGAQVTQLAARHPGAPLILAHAGISDLGLIAPACAELPNVFFDTSWWQVGDLLALFTTIAPGQILYASDMPYGSGRFAALNMLRCAREVGLGAEAIASIAGGQAERLVAGDAPLDVGAAPGAQALGSRWLAGERIIAYCAAAGQMAFRGADPAEPLALGRLACQVPAGNGSPTAEDALLAACDALLEEAQVRLERAPDEPRSAIYPAMAAQMLAGTPRVPV
jgi:predicted TIM-barrel fold metal-dependent hydrolase